MNKIYGVVWNAVTRTWTAVAETAKGRSKGKGVSTVSMAAALALGMPLAAAAAADDACETADKRAGTLNAAGQCTAAAAARALMAQQGAAAADDTFADDGSAFETYIRVTQGPGGGAQASDVGATAVGSGAEAHGTGAAALGAFAQARADSATAIGHYAKANGAYAAALGPYSTADGDYSIAVGDRTVANASQAVALGAHAAAGGVGAVALGNAAAAGQDNTVALGREATANSANSVALGAYSNTGTRTGVVAVGGSNVGQQRQIINMANGAVDTDGATVGQLRGAVNIVGGDVAADGSITAPTYTLDGDQKFGTVAGALTNLDGRLFSNTKNLADMDARVVDNADGITALDTEAVTHAAKLKVLDKALNSTEVQIGSDAAAGGSLSVAIGTASVASRDGAVALGAQSSAQAIGAVALGKDSAANSSGATALGSNAKSSANGAVALGYGADASATNSVALGAGSATGARANAVAVGGSGANQQRQIINMASGTAATDGATVGQLKGALAILGGEVEADGSITAPTYALDGDKPFTTVGGALTNLDGRVTTNATSITDLDGRAATNTESIQEVAGHVTTNTTSIQEIDGRVVTNAGNLTALDGRLTTNTGKITDLGRALNGTEVKIGSDAAAGGSLSMAIGAASVAGRDGAMAIGAQSSAQAVGAVALGKDSVANGGSAIALGTSANSSASNAVALGYQADASSSNSVALGASSATGARANVVAVGGAAAGQQRQIINMAAGTLSATSTDAVNGSQLYATNQRIETINGNLDDVGNMVTYDDATHTQLTLNRGSAAAKLGNVAVGALSATSTEAVNGSQLYATNRQVAAHGGELTTLTTQLDTLNGSLAETVKYDSTAHDVVTLGTAGTAVQMTNVKAGTLSEGSTDAVNGSQLHATNQRVDAINDDLGGVGNMVTYDDATHAQLTLNRGGAAAAKLGNLAAGDLSVSSTDAVNGSQLYATNQQVGAHGGELTTLATRLDTLNGALAETIKYDSEAHDLVTFGTAGTAVRVTNIKAGELSASSTDAVNGSQLHATNQRVDTISDNLGDIEHMVAYDDATHAQLTLNRGGAAAKLGNVAAGALSASSTEAVNGSQLYATNERIDTINGNLDNVENMVSYDADSQFGQVTLRGGAAGTLITNLRDGSIVAGSRDAVNGGQIAAMRDSLQGQITHIDGRVTQVENNGGGGNGGGDDTGSGSGNGGDNDSGNGASNPHFGANAGTAAKHAAASGERSVAAGGDARAPGQDSTALGHGAQAPGRNAVALGAGSVAERGNTVSVGSAGSERQITNVAAGSADTDAVNVGQLNNMVGGVRADLDTYRKNANAGTAAAVAIANLPQAALAGESMVSVAGGTYGGESAVAFGVSTATRNGRWVVKATGSSNTQGTVAVGGGVGYRW